MTFRRRQLLGWVGLAAAALAGLAWLARLDFGQKISTDVLDLIPPGESSPEMVLVRQLASQAEARSMLFVLESPDGLTAPAAAATRFTAALAADPAFADVQALEAGSPIQAGLGRALAEHRFQLLFPFWLQERDAVRIAAGVSAAGRAEWLARDAAARLAEFLATPEALGFAETIPSDPLRLYPDALARFREGLALMQPASSGDSAPPRVWARLAASPFTEAGQGPAFAAIAQALATTREEFPGVTVADTGVNRFAASSRARIQREVAWLNGLSLAAVLAVSFLFIRAVHRGLHLLPVVLLSILGAWVCVTLFFDRVHILVFVIGSLLTGVAIDYGFYLFMQPPAGPDETYGAKVSRLAKPLLASCATTVAGFALLLFSPLPVIRQLGVFVGAGLLGALAAAVAYFATVANPFLPSREFRGARALPENWRRGTHRALIVVWVAALPGLALLRWRDDVRDLEIPAPELHREDARIRALFGQGVDRTVYLTYASDLPSARAALARFEQWLRTAGGGRTRTAGLGALVPTAEDYLAAMRFVREEPAFPGHLRAALESAGFDATEFEPFFVDYARVDPNVPAEAALGGAAAALRAGLPGPLSLLLHTDGPLSWFVTIAGNAPTTAPPPDLQTQSSGQLQSLNSAFRRYRQSALQFSAAGLAVVGLGVLLTYGLRDGLRIFAIPGGACLGIFGLFGWLGQPLNLFHLLGAFLGVCLTHNYSIFSATSAFRREPPPVSVRLSGLTTAASFGVLALSGIPVVAALGSTVALMVLGALLVLEFEHLGALGARP